MYKLLINKIKEKKPLDRLDDAYVRERIEDFLKKNTKLAKKIDFENERNKDFKTVLKAVRDELNKRYGIFWSDEFNLESHRSSKERMGFYNELYKKIFAITGKPNSILDISAGLNPLSIKYMDGFEGKYVSTELAQKDCEMINRYFKENKINGKAIQQDITKNLEFPEADVVFLFKVFDSVEEKGHKLAERILKDLKCRYAVISFATRTAWGKKMNFPNRGWIERLFERLELSYKKLEFENEVFYVVRLIGDA